MVRKKLCRQPGIDINEYDVDNNGNENDEDDDADNRDKIAETNTKPPILATCCACGEAKYEVCM